MEGVGTQTVPQKRLAEDESVEHPLNLKGSQFLIPTPPATTGSEESPASRLHREVSPAASVSTLSSIQDVSSIGDAAVSRTQTTDPRPVKRRKLTPAEKVEQQREKEMKAQAKAEAKAQKEAEKAAEKAVKDEDKRKRDEEKRKKAEEREDKKRQKELDEERRAQEALKKERSQMRLGAFFGNSATAQHQSPEKLSTRRRSLSVETYDAVKNAIGQTSPTKSSAEAQSITTSKQQPTATTSDYHKFFLAYELKPHIIWQPPNTATSDEQQSAQARFDTQLQPESLPEQFDLGIIPTYASLKEHFQDSRHSRGLQTACTKALVQQIENSAPQYVDLTRDASTDPHTQLSRITMRQLHFHEDVRPAYFGTYTRITSPRSKKKLSRNPFARERTDTNYDYDSEAEWVEGEPDDEAGEDIGSDDEDVSDDGHGHEMDEFLDDEDDELQARRKIVVSDLEPHCTGLCWEDTSGKLRPGAGASPSKAMSGLRLQFLLPDFKGTSIDPFSTSYWQTTQVKKPMSDTVLMRPPLIERSSNLSARSDSGWSMLGKTQAQPVKKGMKPGAQKTMNAAELEQFKAVVVGSLSGKAELLTELKTRFPTFTTVLIKDTLGDKFAQRGKTKADKNWVYVGDA